MAGQAGERETQGPDHWKDLHTTCPASSLEYGATGGVCVELWEAPGLRREEGVLVG